MRAGQLVAGRYRLEEQIGAGGNGMVWRAVDEELDRVVAVKRALSGNSERGPERIRLLRREAKILAKLNHPHVVTLFDVVAEGIEWWLVMEYVALRSLADQSTLPPDRVARLGAQIAGALEAVHAAGVVHRDIKPGNVLVTENGRAKLSDFGISRAVRADVTLDETGGLFAGTPGYVAPEVANGEDPGPASDVFSLGATLYATAEGRSPFGVTDNPLVLLRRAAEGDVAAPSRAGALAPVLSALMHVDPSRRPTAAQARRLLDEVVAGTSADSGSSRPPGRRPRVAAAVGAGAAALAIAAWLVVDAPSGSGREDPRPRSASPSPIVGDPRTADPCALADPTAFARFGETELDTNYGNFNRCDVIVRSRGRSEVDVKVELDNARAGETNPAARTEKVGGLSIVRQPVNNDECDRTLLLGDGNSVEITAVQNGDGRADLCAMAEVATTRAVAVLSRGQIPRRTAPPAATSLIRADSCALLDADALARFPGVDALHPEVGFGGWECRWNSTTSPTSLLLRFDRNQPLTAADGHPTRLGGHDAFVEPDGYGDKTCLVSVVHRRYVDADAQPMVELLLVVVTGSQPPDRLCQLATDLAGPAAAELPPS